MLPADKSRCCAVMDFTSAAEVCPRRDDCERYRQWSESGVGDVPASLWRCETDAFEAQFPRPCGGVTMPLSPRPHYLCSGRNGHPVCRRFKYGATDGITPRFIRDGQPTCADRLIHVNTVGDDPMVCAPTR